MKVIVLLLLAAIVVSLGSGLFFLTKDKGDNSSPRLLRALKIRVGLSVAECDGRWDPGPDEQGCNQATQPEGSGANAEMMRNYEELEGTPRGDIHRRRPPMRTARCMPPPSRTRKRYRRPKRLSRMRRMR